MAAPKKTSAVATATAVASKTARKSTSNRAGKAETFKAAGELDRIVSLDNGNWAYLRDPRDGILHHLATDSEEWSLLIKTLLADATHGPRIAQEINTMRRSKIYDRYVALTDSGGNTENQSE